ncbi:MAG: 50S ribosomal protein L18Ae [Methanobacteriota archaeon]
MKAFRVDGRFRMGRAWQAFAKEVAAADAEAAREKLLSILGSQHGVARKYIEVGGIAEVPPADVADPAVRYALEVRA